MEAPYGSVEWRYRKYMWLHHTCDFMALYGDDGEMQCGECLLDFRRDSLETVENRLWEKNLKRVTAMYGHDTMHGPL